MKMIRSKRNIVIGVTIAAAVLVCALAMAMVSCSGSAVAADDRPAAEDTFLEDAIEDDVSDESVEAETNSDVVEGAEATEPGSANEGADAPTAESSPSAAPSTRSTTPSASAPVTSPKSTSAPTQDAQTQSNAHTHNWIAEKTPQTVIDQAAWTETQYKTVEHEICSVCGEDLTYGDSQGRSLNEHGKAHVLAGEGGGWHSEFRQEAVGVIEHPAKTHIEYTVTGYHCSSCGATKGA